MLLKRVCKLKKNILSETPHFTGTLDAFYKIIRNEGVLTLWRGLIPTLWMTVPATTLYFTTYEKLHSMLKPELGSFSPLLSGSIARIMTATASSPLEMLRTYLQSNGGKEAKNLSLIEICRKSIKIGGIGSLWTGLVPTLWRDVPFSALYWYIYEESRRTFFKRPSFRDHFSAGALAGTIAAFLTVPFDVLKTRQQMNILDTTTITTKRSFMNNAISIYKEEGTSAFFKGSFPRAARVAPACAIMISSYEFVKQKLRNRKSKRN
jgi:solute carrier family 25 protein 39/40